MKAERILPASLAGLFAALSFLVSFGVEHLLLRAQLAPMVLIPGLLNLRYAWNHGISFSLLWQDSVMGGRLLSAAMLAMIALLAVLAWRTHNVLAACGLGLMIGGALGNLIDRQLYGAVFDFLALHLGGLPLFVCNMADITLSLGVVLLAWDALFTSETAAR